MTLPLHLLFILCIFSCSHQQQSTVERIGVFSGTFDPPHLSHVETVNRFISKLKLDKLYLIVNPVSHHKKQVTPYKQRREMSALVFTHPKITLINQSLENVFKEQDMLGILLHVRKTYPKSRIIQIMGSDSFERFAKISSKPKLKNYELAVRVRDKNRPIVNNLKIPYRFHEFYLQQSYSSSQIRRELKEKKTAEGLSNEVRSYIKTHGLYLK